MKKIVLPALLKIWRHEVRQAGDLSLSPENMEPPDLEELFSLVHDLAFDRCAIF